MRAALTPLALCLASPAIAALGDDTTSAPYRGICTMPQICSATAGCAATPVIGEVLITIDGDGTAMGRRDQDLTPIDHYPTLDDAFPLPAIETHRRSFLVDLPPQGRTRRFAIHIQLLDAQTRDPVLRPRYWVLDCLEVPA